MWEGVRERAGERDDRVCERARERGGIGREGM